MLFNISADVFLYPVQLISRDIDLIAALIAKLDIITGFAVHGQGRYAIESSYSMTLMDYQIPGRKLRKR